MTHLRSKALDLRSGVVQAKFNRFSPSQILSSAIQHSIFFFVFQAAQDTLLRSIIANRHHVLRALMPPIVIMKYMYDLRPGPHNFALTRMIATSSQEHYTKARPQINNNNNLSK